MTDHAPTRTDAAGQAIISGGGLKTIEAVVDEVEEPLHVQPTVESFVEARRARYGEPVTA